MKLIVETDQKTIDECKKLFAEGYSNNAEYAIANGKPYEERPQGEWIVNTGFDNFRDTHIVTTYTCPFCNHRYYTKYPFCTCGADMKGE